MSMPAYVYPPVVPPGYAPPFAVVTETDHRAWIFIAAALGASLTLLASGIRVFIRTETKSGCGMDDAVLAVATALALVQTAIVLTAGSYGLGASASQIGSSSITVVQKLYYASNLLYVISLGASRSSVALFLRRLTPINAHIRILNGLLAAEVTWVLANVLVVALQCDITRPWNFSPSCATGWFTRWLAAESIGAFFEVAIFAVATWMLTWKLKLPFRKRVVVTTVFGLRVVLMITIITFRLTSFDKAGFISDPTLHEAAFICWTQAELNISMIAATIPIAHRFLASLVTHWGGAGGRSLSQSMYTTRSNSDAMKLDTIQSTTSKKADVPKPVNEREEIEHRSEDDEFSYVVNATAPLDIEDGGDIVYATTAGNSQSRDKLIRQDVNYHVEHGTRWYD